MGIKKQYLVSRPVCKVTFSISATQSNSARSAHLVGEFNRWDQKATPMKRLKTGAFKTTLDLEPGREYQFRYLLDSRKWLNEADADGAAPTPFGDSANSLISL